MADEGESAHPLSGGEDEEDIVELVDLRDEDADDSSGEFRSFMLSNKKAKHIFYFSHSQTLNLRSF